LFASNWFYFPSISAIQGTLLFVETPGWFASIALLDFFFS